LEHHVNIHQ
jgi:topoisomerase IA-like protein